MNSYATTLVVAFSAVLAFVGLGGAFDDAIAGGSTPTAAVVPAIENGSRVTPSGALVPAVSRQAAIIPEFLAEPAILRRLLTNVSSEGTMPGSVMAAVGGNSEYLYHWSRDAAITMREVLERVRRGGDAAEEAKLVGTLDDYFDFSWRSVLSPTESGHGEPKVTPRAEPFTEEWGRPQNDGPALRALLGVDYYEWLLDHPNATSRNAPGANQLRSSLLPMIKSDLDYLELNWRAPSFDVWEEVLADHYYTRAVQERAFRRASELAQRLGDATSEQRFRSTADEIRTSLLGYWDEQEGVLRTHLPESFVRGKDYKASGLDTTVLMARMHTGADAKAILDDQLLATATRLEDAFHEQYAVNHVEKAPLVGRYPEDRYTGLPHQDREGGGNPWLITTNAFAELHYRVADALGSEGAVTFTDRNAAFYLTALDSKRTARGHAALEELGDLLGLHDGERTLRTDSDAFERLQSALVDRGDSFLERVQENITAEGRHTEQIHRDTGAPIGAEQLTWNEASLLSAYRARRAALR